MIEQTMSYFRRRRLRKQIKHLLHEARHARHMREDIAKASDVDALIAAEQALQDAWKQKASEQAIEEKADHIAHLVQRIYPPVPHPRRREYVEMLVVAVGVAMAFRTYFIQPFKIPTGSMEPTLYGIKESPLQEKGLMDYFPLSVVNFLLFGERYVEVRAPASGVVDTMMKGNKVIYSLSGIVPPHSEDLQTLVKPGDYVEKGQTVARGRKRSGDHIFVNKVRYNYTRPKRGDVFVFSTDGVEHPDVKIDTYYIKRLVGLPGERVAIDPPYLVVDGQRVLDPDVFERQAHDRDAGYYGYVIPPSNPLQSPQPVLRRRNLAYQLGPTEYLPLGDNTMFSLDGRYFGGIRQENIVGPAFAVYWPFSKRWGFIE
jgi:signal peptidase I